MRVLACRQAQSAAREGERQWFWPRSSPWVPYGPHPTRDGRSKASRLQAFCCDRKPHPSSPRAGWPLRQDSDTRVLSVSGRVHYLNYYVSPRVMAKVKTAVSSMNKSSVLISHRVVSTFLIGTIYMETWQPAPSSNCRWKMDAGLCCAVKM